MYIFYHEHKGTSTGLAVLIINLIRGLVAAGEKVALINYTDGDIYDNLKRLPASALTIINRDEKSIGVFANSVSSADTILTTHYYTVYRLFKKADPKIIFYCVNITSLPVASKYFNRVHIKWMTRNV